MTARSSIELGLGDRILIIGSHSYAGKRGVIVGSLGRVFNGWTVKLEGGLHVGVGTKQMRKFP